MTRALQMHVGAFASLLFFVVPAVAQEESNNQTAADTILEEVITTAQRRETALQDTALSVVSVTGEALKVRGIMNARDIGEMAANLTLKEPDRIGENRVHIRGIGGGNYNPIYVYGTGIYVDGHYIPGMVGNQMSTLDVERVEVLRGPQGTLFGKNVTGGAVNIISTKPRDYFEARVTGRAGELGTKRIGGMVNVPFSSNVYGRFSADWEETDGHYWNRFLNEHQDWRDNKSYRAAVRWEPTDRWTIDFAATRYDAEGGQNGVTCVVTPRPSVINALNNNGYAADVAANGWVATPDIGAGENGWGAAAWNPGAAGGVGLLDVFFGAGSTVEWFEGCDLDNSLGEFVTSSELRPVSWEKTNGLFLTANWDSDGAVGFLDNLGITINAGKRDTDHGWVIDLDYTPFPIFAIAHVNSHKGTPGLIVGTENLEVLFDMTINDKAQLVVGANYFDDSQTTGDGSCLRTYYNDYLPGVATDPDYEVPCGPAVSSKHGGLVFQWINTFDNYLGFNRFLSNGFENVDTGTESKAFFAHLTYALSDNWELAVGARYTRDTRAFATIDIETGFNASNPSCVTSDPTPCDVMPLINATNLNFSNKNSATFSDTTPMISLSRHFASGMVYGLISDGYLTGSFNDELDAENYPAVGQIASYDPEHVRNFEIGYKGTFLDGRVQLNADVFRMDYTDKQEQFQFANPFIDENNPSLGRWFGVTEDVEATINAGKVRATGIEVELRASPWRDGFVTLDLGTLDMDYLEFEVPSLITGDGRDVAGSSLDYTNRHIHSRTPDWQYNATVGHTFSIGGGGQLTPMISMYRQGGYEWAWDSLQFPFTPPLLSEAKSACYQDAYSKFRMRLNYRPPSDRWEASIYGSNVTDERIIFHCQWDRTGTIKRGWEAPRVWAAEFTAYFGS